MVKRYDLAAHLCDGESGICLADMEHADDGDYVAHTDYAALKAENAKLRERIEQAPHGRECAAMLVDIETETDENGSAKAFHVKNCGHPCNCWKSAP